MSAPFAVLFDMDGVIFDSERMLRDCWMAIADREGLENMREVYGLCIGVNQRASDEILRQAYGRDFPVERFKQRAVGLFRERMAAESLPVKPGAREILQALKERSIPLALASSTDQGPVRRELAEAGLLAYFDVLVTGDMVKNSKPHPEIFLTAAELLGVEPGDCFVIEDSYNGVRAAAAAGMRPIMVPDLLAPDEEMAALAEAILPDLNRAQDLVLRNWCAVRRK